jgi:hypothetical protein
MSRRSNKMGGTSEQNNPNEFSPQTNYEISALHQRVQSFSEGMHQMSNKHIIEGAQAGFDPDYF